MSETVFRELTQFCGAPVILSTHKDS